MVAIQRRSARTVNMAGMVDFQVFDYYKTQSCGHNVIKRWISVTKIKV